MSTAAPKPRLYRFGQRDRTGWLLGLQASQCVAVGGGILTGGLLLNVGAPTPAVLLPLLVSSLFAFGRWNREPLHEHVPVLLGWVTAAATRQHAWAAAPRRFRHPQASSIAQPELPPALAGQSITESTRTGWARPGHDARAAVIRDRRDGTLSAVLRVHGRGFSLSARPDQERLLQVWGDALAAFCAERGPVGRFRWIEWASPASLDGQLAYVAEHRDPNAAAGPMAAYRELLDHAGPMATRHEVLVVVTVEDRRLPPRSRHSDRDRVSAAEDALMEEVRLLAARLDAAGLAVDAPLSPDEIAYAWRARLDPYRVPGVRSARHRSLVELAGLVSVANAGPLSMQAERDHVRVDGAMHAAYVIAEWPRLDVPPAWMEPLLLHAGGIRTVAVHYEPVAPSRSKRNIDRETVKLASDEEQRSRSGFRIGARHRRAQADVLEREAELVAGFAEFEFIGFVVVTARDIEDLERSCAEYEQVAAQSGLELRRLDGRHDLALACALPMGRGLATRRFG
jgi:hypothetical protein